MMLQETAPPAAATEKPEAGAAQAPSAALAAAEALPREPNVGCARFLGSERVYWRILIRGALLLMVTLGIYRFWLVTDMRRFLWSKTEVAGDGLEYTGTAGEILIGFLIAITLLVPINVGFFILGLGVIGRWSAVLGFIALAWFGQFAIYRARRYRLTRTIYRGIRFHQAGAGWRYAFRALAWWAAIGLTLGLAYPWAQASLERYKMRNTFYGDLGGRFLGSGTRLFFRGVLLWLIVVVPFVIGEIVAIGSVDWTAVGEALRRGGSNPLGRVEGISPDFGAAIVLAILSACWVAFAAALLYPAFQAMTLRWWMSGIRFGDLTVKSRLRTTRMYGVYLRFVGYALLLGLIITAMWVAGFAVFGALFGAPAKSAATEITGAIAGVVSYVAIMLGYSTIYQATVKLRTWRVAFESLELSGLQALDHVHAQGAPSSGFGEGLADALNVGAI